MYRVSELTYEVDFLANHDSADALGQVAFLSSGAQDGTAAFAKEPVTEYCVEHLDRPWAPYVSCNGPEAKPRNDPSDPTCMCDVYADRMIGLQTRTQMDAACGKSPTKKDGTHTANPCNCSNAGGSTQKPTKDWSKWTLPSDSTQFVGRQQLWLPYFYYQRPRDTYPDTIPFGLWYSTPKAGECREDQELGNGGCTWKRHARARVIWGEQLLQLGWNATYVKHWPLHEYGHNNTEQCLQNAPLFNAAFSQLSRLVAASPACGEDDTGPTAFV